MIEVRELTKYYGTKKAVDNISFSVEKGEILGFLGPNAAGKSTTMRMITGFIPPSGGTAVIGGSDIISDSLAAREKIGYLPENAPAYPDMSVFDFLDFCQLFAVRQPDQAYTLGVAAHFTDIAHCNAHQGAAVGNQHHLVFIVHLYRTDDCTVPFIGLN